MLIVLPPSETKRDGGAEGSRLVLSELGFASLNPTRRRVLAELRELSADAQAAARALKLGATQAHEVERNRRIRRAPVLPSIDRYDGVLYDALDATTLPAVSRDFAQRHLVIASALFGLTRALDPIPAYRLSADSRLSGGALKQRWSEPLGSVLAAVDGLVLDVRSEAYAALGPAPRRENSLFVRVVSDDGGRRRALNHFNKAGKGALVRALLLAGIAHPDVDSLLGWAAGEGIRLERGQPGELDLVV